MISPHLHPKINGAEQIDRSLVAAAHAPSPNLVEANEYAADLRRAPSTPARISRLPALSEASRAIWATRVVQQGQTYVNKCLLVRPVPERKPKLATRPAHCFCATTRSTTAIGESRSSWVLTPLRRISVALALVGYP